MMFLVNEQMLMFLIMGLFGFIGFFALWILQAAEIKRLDNKARKKILGIINKGQGE